MNHPLPDRLVAADRPVVNRSAADGRLVADGRPAVAAHSAAAVVVPGPAAVGVGRAAVVVEVEGAGTRLLASHTEFLSSPNHVEFILFQTTTFRTTTGE